MDPLRKSPNNREVQSILETCENINAALDFLCKFDPKYCLEQEALKKKEQNP